VEAFKVWRYYLESALTTVQVQSNHENLKYFYLKKVTKLNARQARWAELLAAYDFEIEYHPGRHNPADAPSRRRDYEAAQAEQDVGLLPTLQRKLMGAQGSQGNVGDPAEALTTRARDPELLALRMVVREAATTETATGPTSRPL
jgi:hypothetical protein